MYMALAQASLGGKLELVNSSSNWTLTDTRQLGTYFTVHIFTHTIFCDSQLEANDNPYVADEETEWRGLSLLQEEAEWAQP